MRSGLTLNVAALGSFPLPVGEGKTFALGVVSIAEMQGHGTPCPYGRVNKNACSYH